MTKLSEYEIDKWHGNRTKIGPKENKIDNCTQVGGHTLRARQKPDSRLDRMAKYNVCYMSSAEPSSDEDYTSPHKKQRQCKPLPLSGPSADRMCAQDLISKRHTSSEKEVASALITLSTDIRDSGASLSASCNDTDTNTSTGKSVPTCSTYSTDSVISGTPSPEGSSSENSGSESSDSANGSASSSSKEATKIDNKYQSDLTEGEISESDIPLAKLRDKIKSAGYDPPDKKRKMEFKTSKTIGIKCKYRRKHNFSCDKLEFTDSSQGGLNTHYLDKHGKLSCPECGKTSVTLSGYRMHLYDHSERASKYSCDDCDKRFPFLSQLKTHRKVHLSSKEHECQQCFKRYKNSGELTKHLAVHSNKTWKCEKCKYTCKDPRNLKAHRHTHGDSTRYFCDKCKSGFNHYQQLKRHRIKNDCV